MSEHKVAIVWTRGDAPFIDNKYSRAHQWKFDGGAIVQGSSSPQVVRVPMSDPSAVDPEEAFIASISSCHMLWFLSIAASRGYVVDSYEDEAVGSMARNERKVFWVDKVVLNPRIRYSGAQQPTPEQQKVMHDEAHEQCFIGNSVKTEVTIR